jgi:molybdopterin converting factor small subunit
MRTPSDCTFSREKSCTTGTPVLWTVKELIDFLSAQYNPQFKERLIDANTGCVRRSHKIPVNGRDIDFLDKLDTRIVDRDGVAFFPPVGGG